jgi:hypothetical protein
LTQNDRPGEIQAAGAYERLDVSGLTCPSDPDQGYRAPPDEPGVKLLVNSISRNDIEVRELFASGVIPQFA